MKKIFSLIFLTMFFFASIAHAEIKNYSGTGEYIMSEFETLDVAKQRAKQKAERNACEQAGVFVSSYTKVKNFQVQEDEIIAITNGILKIFDVKENLIPQNGGKNILIQVTIKASIDSDEINKWLEKGIEQRSELARQNEELRKAVAEQDKKIAELQKQIKNVKTQQDKEKITQEFKNEDKIFLSNQKVEEGNKFFDKNDYNSAINFYSQAIELNPNNYFAYYRLGLVNHTLRYYSQAISDFNQAIKINPNYSKAYHHRGLVYLDLENYEQTISDFNQAIKLDSNNFDVYYSRGLLFYVTLGEYNKAILDFSRCIHLRPEFFASYYLRARCYLELGEIEMSMQDYRKAEELMWS